MLRIMSLIQGEDYMNLHSMNENNVAINYYGYTFEVEGGPEETGGKGLVKVIVFEFSNAHLALGFAVPVEKEIEDKIEIGFINQDNPSKDITVECKLSDEVKRTTYMADDREKLEYIGFSLEKFYQNKGAAFYFNDLRPSAQKQTNQK